MEINDGEEFIFSNDLDQVIDDEIGTVRAERFVVETQMDFVLGLIFRS